MSFCFMKPWSLTDGKPGGIDYVTGRNEITSHQALRLTDTEA